MDMGFFLQRYAETSCEAGRDECNTFRRYSVCDLASSGPRIEKIVATNVLERSRISCDVALGCGRGLFLWKKESKLVEEVMKHTSSARFGAGASFLI